MKVCQKGCVIPYLKLPFISFAALHNLAVKHKNGPFMYISKNNKTKLTSENIRTLKDKDKALKLFENGNFFKCSIQKTNKNNFYGQESPSVTKQKNNR